MKCENAKDVLPEELFDQVQKYASGKLLYFPIAGKRCLWGTKTGNRYKNEKRNEKIRQLYENGYSHDQLSEMFYLTPESIKNIVYSKKRTKGTKKTKMDLDEILKLYDETPPLSVKPAWSITDEMMEWGEYYYLADYEVTFESRRLMLHIHHYHFTSPARIAEQDRIAQAYREAGCDVCRIVPTISGELCRTVSHEGHDCVVFAEECCGNTFPVTDQTPKDESGRYLLSDELLTLVARVGNLHLDFKEPNYAVLFDNFSSAPEFEDWIAEYTESELPGRIRRSHPELTALYEKINAELRRVRKELRTVYPKLPRSAFHGEEGPGGKPAFVLTDRDGHLASLCDFTDGGEDVCVTHFLCLAMQLDEMLPEDYVWLAVHDPEVNRQRIESVIHSMKVIGKEYEWNEDELTALPLIYKLMLFGRPYYYGTLFGLVDDRDKLKEMLEFILGQITGPDEIDFRKILS